MTDVGDESLPQRRVVEASNDPRKDRTARTPRDCRLIIDVQPRRKTNATASCATPCTSPVQVLCKPRRNPVESLFACSVVPTIVPSLSNLVKLFLVRLSLPAIPTLDLSPLLPNVSRFVSVFHTRTASTLEAGFPIRSLSPIYLSLLFARR